MADHRFETRCDVLKVDTKLGLVFGWGMVCSKDGEVYRDLDSERVSTDEMLKAVTEFGANAVRPTDEMHDEKPDGTVVHSFPLTDDIAKVFGIEAETEGWMVAVKPSPEVLEKFEDGTYTGFSIGGTVGGWTDESEEAA